jgi:hypothetical protein
VGRHGVEGAGSFDGGGTAGADGLTSGWVGCFSVGCFSVGCFSVGCFWVDCFVAGFFAPPAAGPPDDPGAFSASF